MSYADKFERREDLNPIWNNHLIPTNTSTRMNSPYLLSPMFGVCFGHLSTLYEKAYLIV